MTNRIISRKEYLVFMALLALIMLPMFAMDATRVLKLTAAASASLYYALQWLSWGTVVVSVVASFGIGFTLAPVVLGVAKKVGFKAFVIW